MPPYLYTCNIVSHTFIQPWLKQLQAVEEAVNSIPRPPPHRDANDCRLALSAVKEGYNVGSDVTVRLDFRSTAPDAVLLGISSTKVDAIGLELISGQVQYHQRKKELLRNINILLELCSYFKLLYYYYIY